MKSLKVSLLCLCIFGMTTAFHSPSAKAEEAINLARPDRDQPGDDFFTLTEAPNEKHYTVENLKNALANDLPEILGHIRPKTDDPAFRNASVKTSGTQIAFSFQKRVTIFWLTQQIAGTTFLESANCPDSQQVGFKIVMNTTGSTSKATQGFVDGAGILICASESVNSRAHILTVSIERDLYAGREYQDWIGLLMGDFLRTFGEALEANLK